MAKFGRRSESLGQLAFESISDMKDVANWENINAVFFSNMCGEKFNGISNISTWISDYIGLSGKLSLRIDTASSSGASAFQTGYLAIASGCYDNVLVLASEKMTHVPTPRVTSVLAEVIDPLERAHGCTMTAMAAMITRKYMHDYGLKHNELAYVAVKNHKNGSLNPYAHFQKEITIDDVLKSKVVADPLKLYDCSPISDGAAAVLLTSKPDKIKVLGIGHGTTHMALQYRDSLTSFTATRIAAKQAFKMANKKPSDIDVAEVHDAFSTFEIINTEDLGFFKHGKGGEGLLAGETKLNGSIPINPSGGLKSRGHPVGVSGLAQIVELVWQLRNEAGARQVKNVETGLSQSIGGIASNNLVNILEVD